MTQSSRLSKKTNGSFFLSRSGKRVDFLHAAGALLLSLSFATTNTLSAFADIPVNTLPTASSSGAGNVQFNQSGNTLNISSEADRSIANHGSFSIGQNATVNVIQPSANSIMLNRVTGGSLSEINGAFNSNGKIFLINPNGILFGRTANVNVASLVASTLNISDNDFLNNKFLFTQTGSSRGIVNEGSLNASNGGSIVLLGGAVKNLGQITAPNGQVLLGVGKEITLQIADGVSSNITIDQALDEQVQGFNSAISNSGTITADGGAVKALARLSTAFYEKLVNNEGVIKANRLNNKNGIIQLIASTDDGKGVVANSGLLTAMNEGAKDGVIQLIGDKLLLESADSSSKIEGRDVFLASGDSININSKINAENLSLRTGGGIEQTEAIEALNLDILSSKSVNLTNNENKIGRLAANVAEEGNTFAVKTSEGLEVKEINGIKGVSTKNGNIDIHSGNGLTLSNSVNAGTADVKLTTDQSNIWQRDGIIVANALYFRTNGGSAVGYTGDGNDNILTSINHLNAETSSGDASFRVVNISNKDIDIQNINAGKSGTVDIETRGTGNITQSGKSINTNTLSLRTNKGNATKDGSATGAPIEGNYSNVYLASAQGGEIKTVNDLGSVTTNFINPDSGNSSSNSGEGTTDNSYVNYLEQTIINDLNNGITSGSITGSSTPIDDVTFRKIVETFKQSASTKSWEEVKGSLAAQGISVAGSIDHSFNTTLANGDAATIKVTGSFKEMYEKMRNESLESAKRAFDQKVSNEIAQEKQHLDAIRVEQNRADTWNQQTSGDKVVTSTTEALEQKQDAIARNKGELEGIERARLAAEQDKLRQEAAIKQEEERQKWWDGLSANEKQNYLAEQEKIKQQQEAQRQANDAAWRLSEEKQRKEELERYYNEYYLNWQAQLDKTAPKTTTPPATSPPSTVTVTPPVASPPTTVTVTPPVNIYKTPPTTVTATPPVTSPPTTVTRIAPGAFTPPAVVNIFTTTPTAPLVAVQAAVPTVAAPVFYKTETPTENIVEETPVVAAPVFYKPAPIEEVPAQEEQPIVPKPVFYYPGLW